MQLSFKTLDNTLIELDAAEDEPIRDIIEKLKDNWGVTNTYRLICAGKVLKDGSILSDYSGIGTLPIIVLITKPAIAKPKYTHNKSSNDSQDQDEAALKNRSKQFALSRRTKYNFNVEENTNDYNVTEKDFSSSLSLIMNCNYLFQEDIVKITKEEMINTVNTKFSDDDPEEAPLKDMILKNLDEVVTAGPNVGQFKAFISLGFCWCQTYCPQRQK